MQYKIITISIFNEGEVEDMNRFLRGNKVINVEKQLVVLNEGAFWSFCIHYIGVENKEYRSSEKEKVDYKNILDEPTFAVFSKLRIIRKKIADNDAIPAYAIFTDAELSKIAVLDEITEKKMLSIHGIGEKKVEKYGKILCNMLTEGLKE
jgi:superfamily II DNA helicase RecQ